MIIRWIDVNLSDYSGSQLTIINKLPHDLIIGIDSEDNVFGI